MSKTPLGNLSGFGKESVTNIVYILGIAYIGGSITSICNSKKIDEIFPYDMDKMPYNNPTKPTGIIQSIFGFPYNWRKEPGSIYNEYYNWFIDTWSYVFSFWRELNAHGAHASKQYLYSGLFGNFFLFYILPYILFYVVNIIPFISFFLAGLGSMHKEYSFVFTFAFITAWIYGFGKCDEITFSCVISAICIGITGVVLSFFYIPWWIVISIATWVYFNTFLCFSPFFSNSPGINKVIEEIKKHETSLTILFMIFTLMSSVTYLNPEVTMGIGICSVYIMYLLHKNNKRGK
jgi:hypothetical protein